MEAAEQGQGLGNKSQIVLDHVALNQSKLVRARPDESRQVGMKRIDLLQVEMTRCLTAGRTNLPGSMEVTSLIRWGVPIGPRVFEKEWGLRMSWKSHCSREAAADNVEPSKRPTRSSSPFARTETKSFNSTRWRCLQAAPHH